MAVPSVTTRVSYSQRCIFCGHENRKRSKLGIFFRCRNCDKVNYGPGAAAIHAQALTVAMQPVPRRERKKPAEKSAALLGAAPAAAATVIVKRASPTATAKPAPVVEAAPAAVKSKTPPPPKPPEAKRGGLGALIYGR